MLPIFVKFQAFIPKSLGKPLLSYFEQDRRFNLLSNKAAFVQKRCGLSVYFNHAITSLL